MTTPDMPVSVPSSTPLPVHGSLAASLGREAPSPAWRDVQSATADVLRIGVVGYGYWGPNVVRNLHGLDSCEVVSVCDKNEAVLKRARRQYPAVQMTTDVRDILTSPDIDAVAIVTPVWTHFLLA